MSEYDNHYVKLPGSAAMWLVENGERRLMGSMDEVYRHGLKPVLVMTEEVLESIPVAGRKKKAQK